MADSKKVKAGAKKTAVKKPTVKKTSVKKVTKRKLTEDDLYIRVPQGEQTIRTFYLTPALPSGGQPGDWIFIDPDEPSPTDIANLFVSFNTESTSTERLYERAVLIIELQQNPSEAGYWRFANGGVAACPGYDDVDNDVSISVSSNGQTLTAIVQVIGETQETVQFGFVASYTHPTTNVVTVYESSDPGFYPGRP